METKLNIVVICATTRENRKTIFAAELVRDVLIAHQDINCIFVDVADYFPLPGEGNDEKSKNADFVAINKQSDAYIIVAPEYNHSFPGSLKMLLDNDLGNYTHKPVVLAGVSKGQFGGVRMIENMLSPLRELGMITLFNDIYFTFINTMFPLASASTEEKAQAAELISKQKERIEKSVTELIRMAGILKQARRQK